jgi:hypothetical protein
MPHGLIYTGEGLKNIKRGKMHFTIEQRYSIETGLPPKQWITGVFRDENCKRLHVVVNTKVIVCGKIFQA